MAETATETENVTPLPWAVVGNAGFDDLARSAQVLGWTLVRGKGGKNARPGRFENGWLGLGDAVHEARVLARALASTLHQPVQLVEWTMGPRGKPQAQGRGVDERGVWASERFDWAKSNLEKVSLPTPALAAVHPKQYAEGVVSLTVGSAWCPDKGGAHGAPIEVSGPGIPAGATLDRSAAYYIRWRLLVLGHAAVGPGPDLSRWEARAMRRARLDAVPGPKDPGWQAYQQEWRTYTQDERSAGPSESHLVAAWKFGPGEWVFGSDELVVMRRALPNQPVDHDPNPWQRGVWQAFEQLLDTATNSLEFRVTPE